MEILIIVVISITVYLIIKSKESVHNVDKGAYDEKTASNKEVKELFVNVAPIPDGYMVYEDQSFFVAGVTFKRQNCEWWVNGKDLSILFKREPNNSHDEHAIAVYGKNDQGSKKIGYIGSDIAFDIVSDGLEKEIKPRLISVRVGDAHFIEYQILIKDKR